MRNSELYNIQVPELGDRSDITVVSDAILYGENNQSGRIEFMNATISDNVITLKSDTRQLKLVKYYKGLSIQFVTPEVLQEGTAVQIKIDDLEAQPFNNKTFADKSSVVFATYDENGFTAYTMGVPVIDNLTTADSKKALSANQGKVLKDNADALEIKVDNHYDEFHKRNVVAGNGLTGGGTLDNDITLSVKPNNDSIMSASSGIYVNTADNLTTASKTRPLSSNQGKYLNEKIDQTAGTLRTEITNTKTELDGKITTLNTTVTNNKKATDTELATKALKTTKITAGSGLSGGGTLGSDMTISAKVDYDSITIGSNGLTVNTVDNLGSSSTTKPLSANQGKFLYANMNTIYQQMVKKAGDTMTGNLIMSGNSQIVATNNSKTTNVARFASTNQLVIGSQTLTDVTIDTNTVKITGGFNTSAQDLRGAINELLQKIKDVNIIPVPVGGILAMYNTTNPATLYTGTTWERIPDNYYIRTGATPLQTGGSSGFTIQKANLPAIKLSVDEHTHTYDKGKSVSHPYDFYTYDPFNIGFETATTSSASLQTETLGSGTEIQYYPIYIFIAFWKRLS